MNNPGKKGTTLVELMIATVLLTIISASMFHMIDSGSRVSRSISSQARMEQEGRNILDDLLDGVGAANRILIPQNTLPVRQVLAYPAMIDNDHDGLFDEDTGSDMTNDGMPGIIGIDDDGDGLVDENLVGAGFPGMADIANDDEDGVSDEERVSLNSLVNLDLDGDGDCIEDLPADSNMDAAPGIIGWDDNLDGLTDYFDMNGNGVVDTAIDIRIAEDDDEDGKVNEDWVDAVVYYSPDGRRLIKRTPAANPVDGTDFSEVVITEHLVKFEVIRLKGLNNRSLLQVSLELADDNGNHVAYKTAVYPKREVGCR